MAEAALTRGEVAERFASLRLRPGNARCAECHAPDTSWVVLDHGVLVCVHCAGAHRGLGTHISKVRSAQHDQFTASELEWLEAGGNAKSAALYEGALPPTVRRPAAAADGCPEVVRRTWLKLKYDEQRFTVGTEQFDEALSHERCEGWLLKLKQGSLLPTWRRRHFRVLGRGRMLSYASDESSSTDESSLRGCLPLAGCAIEVDEQEPLHMKLRTFHEVGAARAAGAAGAAGAAAGGRGGSLYGGSGGSSSRSAGSGKASTMLLRAFSAADAERWAWTLYQCGHAATVRASEETAEEAAATAATLLKVRSSRQRRSLPFFAQRRSAVAVVDSAPVALS